MAFKKSPAIFNPMALFLGVDRVALVAAHMANVTAFISGFNIGLERDCSQMRSTDDIQLGTDKHVILVPLHVQEGGSIRLPW